MHDTLPDQILRHFACLALPFSNVHAHQRITTDAIRGDEYGQQKAPIPHLGVPPDVTVMVEPKVKPAVPDVCLQPRTPLPLLYHTVAAAFDAEICSEGSAGQDGRPRIHPRRTCVPARCWQAF